MLPSTSYLKLFSSSWKFFRNEAVTPRGAASVLCRMLPFERWTLTLPGNKKFFLIQHFFSNVNNSTVISEPESEQWRDILPILLPIFFRDAPDIRPFLISGIWSDARTPYRISGKAGYRISGQISGWCLADLIIYLVFLQIRQEKICTKINLLLLDHAFFSFCKSL
jgi:hypothetical protein